MRAYTQGGWPHRQRVSTTFSTWKQLSMLLTGFELGSWNPLIGVRRSTNWANPSPRDCDSFFFFTPTDLIYADFTPTDWFTPTLPRQIWFTPTLPRQIWFTPTLPGQIWFTPTLPVQIWFTPTDLSRVFFQQASCKAYCACCVHAPSLSRFTYPTYKLYTKAIFFICDSYLFDKWNIMHHVQSEQTNIKGTEYIFFIRYRYLWHVKHY